MKRTPAPSPTRRTLALAAAGAMTLGLLPTAGATATDHVPPPRDTDRVCEAADAYDNAYRDVSADTTHGRNILCVSDHGIAEGYDDHTYRPGRRVLRQQMASFIARMIELERPLFDGDDEFDDVDPRSPHARSIDALAESGIVDGRGDGTFGPQDPVRRDQMASFIARALDYIDNGAIDGSAPPAADDGPFFADVTTDNTHAAAINALTQQAVVSGYGDGSYGPGDVVRRDQMASFIARAYDFVDEWFEQHPPEP